MTRIRSESGQGEAPRILSLLAKRAFTSCTTAALGVASSTGSMRATVPGGQWGLWAI